MFNFIEKEEKKIDNSLNNNINKSEKGYLNLINKNNDKTLILHSDNAGCPYEVSKFENEKDNSDNNSLSSSRAHSPFDGYELTSGSSSINSDTTESEVNSDIELKIREKINNKIPKAFTLKGQNAKINQKKIFIIQSILGLIKSQEICGKM